MFSRAVFRKSTERAKHGNFELLGIQICGRSLLRGWCTIPTGWLMDQLCLPSLSAVTRHSHSGFPPHHLKVPPLLVALPHAPPPRTFPPSPVPSRLMAVSWEGVKQTGRSLSSNAIVVKESPPRAAAATGVLSGSTM